MITLRSLATCAGRTANPIYVRALFDDRSPHSVLELTRRRTQHTIDLNVVLVNEQGWFPLPARVDAALALAFPLLDDEADIQPGLIQHFEIDGHDQYAFIDSSDEAKELRQRFGFPGKAIDCFFVHEYRGAALGSSPIFGRCHTDSAPNSGLVISMEGDLNTVAFTIAHEICHYLGLIHLDDPDNLMNRTVPNGGNLTSDQVKRLRKHCMLYRSCRLDR